MSLAWSSVKSLSIPVGGVSRDVQAVSIGGVTVWEKPSPLPYDAEVQYIESTGTQYIDTGVAYFADFEIGIVCPTLNGINAIGTDVRNRLTRIAQSAPNWQVLVTGRQLQSTVPLTTYCDIAYKGGIFTVNGVQFGSASNPFNSGNLTLFTSAHNLPTSYPATVYYLRLFDSSGATVRDFIPVRVGSGANAVGYLYDRANPTGGPSGNGLYGNIGSGAFVVGPDKTAASLLSSAPSPSPLSLEPDAAATESEPQEEPQTD